VSDIPNMSTEVDELVSLARNNVDLAKGICEILDQGTPFVCTDIDVLPAVSTGDRVFTYHLSDPLKVLLAAAKAGKIDAINVPVRN